MSLAKKLDAFRGLKAVVLGDLMLDSYIFGTASRISPEAPVMVVRQERTRDVPGGAANVALNVSALGARVFLVGVAGEDTAGKALGDALASHGASLTASLVPARRQTTRKTRVVANVAHQVLRIDHETEEPIPDPVADQVLAAVARALDGAHVLVLSDYLKGTLTERVAQEAIAAAEQRGVPVVANPKPKSAARFKGAQVVTLNRSEAADLSGLDLNLADTALEAAGQVKATIGAEAVVVTLGADGMVAVTEAGSLQVGAPKVEVADVAGAGDTAVATIALARALGPLDRTALELAAQTSARVVRHVGVAVPNEQDLAEIRSL